MCKHLENCPADCCMQCISSNNSFGSQLTFAQIMAKNVERQLQRRKEILNARELARTDFKIDYDGTDLKIRLIQGK